MSKKSKHRHDHFQKTWSDMGLATTVKVDNPAPFAPSPETKQPASSVSRLAQTLNPLRLSPLKAWKEKKAARKLKKLAKEMAKGKTMMNLRRSRLPLVVALCAVLLGTGSYYLYRSLRMPKVRVSHVAKEWLDTTSGKHHGKRHHARHIVRHGRHNGSRLAHHKHSKHRLAHHKKHGKARVAKRKAHGRYQTASYRQAE